MTDIERVSFASRDPGQTVAGFQPLLLVQQRTLRQHYAGLAMQACIGALLSTSKMRPATEEEIADQAVAFADALIRKLG